jgi:hypothetical protein
MEQYNRNLILLQLKKCAYICGLETKMREGEPYMCGNRSQITMYGEE